MTGSRGTGHLWQRSAPTGVAVSRAAGTPEPAATAPRRKGGRGCGQKGDGAGLPKADLKPDLPGRGPSPPQPEVVGAPGTGGAGM